MSGEHDELVRRHLRIGWGALGLFATVGLVLELMHGLKLGFYLDVGNETRRLLLTLAHAHGVLLGLVHVAFAATLRALPSDGPNLSRASTLLTVAVVFLPSGFLLGGLFPYDGDPGVGVALTPIGALGLVLAVALIFVSLRQNR